MGNKTGKALRVAQYNIKLTTVLTYGKDLYLDTCALEPSSDENNGGLFGEYRLAIAKSREEKTGAIKKEMRAHSQNLARHLSHPQAHIISEVRDEADTYFKLVHGDITRNISPRDSEPWRLPIRIAEEAIRQNNERFTRGGRERNYLIDNVLELLPREISTVSKNPSLADRKLVAVAFSDAIASGKDKTILAYDKGVSATLNELSDILKQDPRALSIKRSRKSLNPFNVQVTTFRPRNGKGTVQRLAHFGKNHRFFRA